MVFSPRSENWCISIQASVPSSRPCGPGLFLAFISHNYPCSLRRTLSGSESLPAFEGPCRGPFVSLQPPFPTVHLTRVKQRVPSLLPPVNAPLGPGKAGATGREQGGTGGRLAGGGIHRRRTGHIGQRSVMKKKASGISVETSSSQMPQGGRATQMLREGGGGPQGVVRPVVG